MLCKKCGTENPEENEHCKKCGKKLRKDTKNKPNFKSKKFLIIIVPIILCITVVVVLQVRKNIYKKKVRQNLNQEISSITQNIFNPTSKDDLTVTNEYSNVKNVKGSYKHFIGGVLNNNSGNIYEYVMIKGILHGTKGEQKKVIGYVTFLGAHQSTNFIALECDDTYLHTTQGLEITEISGQILPPEKNITDNFSIYSKDILGYSDFISMSYRIKNISKKSYNEPLTVFITIKSKSTGLSFTGYQEFSSINSNVSMSGYIKNNYLMYSDGIGSSYLNGEDMTQYYDFTLDCVMLGDKNNIEESIKEKISEYENN